MAERHEAGDEKQHGWDVDERLEPDVISHSDSGATTSGTSSTTTSTVSLSTTSGGPSIVSGLSSSEELAR